LWGPQGLIALFFRLGHSLRNAHFTLHFELSGPGCVVNPNARQKTGVKKVFTRLKPAPPLTSVQYNQSTIKKGQITQYAMNRELFSEFCEDENFAKLSQQELAMMKKFNPKKK
jgi:hypothetical protein